MKAPESYTGPESYAGARVTVMGLGLHGGGASAARFLAREGAEVTVTDLRGETELAASLDSIASLPIRFVLGRHEDGDFADADIVIKNPAVPRSSRYLALARRIETDISIFLSRTSSPIVAITGTKGKSSTSSAAHHILSETVGNAFLGGNITRSPLEFVDELTEESTVVLELSSFQLGDLTLTGAGIEALRPRISVITSIFRDHLNYYDSMDDYVADKRLIYAAQQSNRLDGRPRRRVGTPLSARNPRAGCGGLGCSARPGRRGSRGRRVARRRGRPRARPGR